MQAKSTRIAYLKRMLKRLDAEELRLNDLVAAGELTQAAADLGTADLKRNRAELLSELRTLESES